MDKKIALASIIMAVIGLILELMRPYTHEVFFYLLHLKVINLDIASLYKLKINIFFYILLLIGGIIHLNNQKGYALLSHIFLIIFFSKIIRIPLIIISIFHYAGSTELMYLLKSVLSFISFSVWVFLSYKGLKYFRETTQIKFTNITGFETELKTFIKASNGKRFLNLLIDTVVMAIIFLSFIGHLSFILADMHVFDNMSEKASRILIIYPLLFILQIPYYFVLESVFQVTPGKLITRTRVVNKEGNRPVRAKFFLRTVCRFLPFETFSALFGTPWHDKLSETYVVNEMRKDVEEVNDIENDNSGEMTTTINGIK